MAAASIAMEELMKEKEGEEEGEEEENSSTEDLTPATEQTLKPWVTLPAVPKWIDCWVLASCIREGLREITHLGG